MLGYEPAGKPESDQAVSPNREISVQDFPPSHLLHVGNCKVEDNHHEVDKKALPIKVKPEEGKTEEPEGKGDDKEDDPHEELHHVFNVEQSSVYLVCEKEKS